jgi:hypothetical protein
LAQSCDLTWHDISLILSSTPSTRGETTGLGRG